MLLGPLSESRHGVLVCIGGKGIFIEGEAGIGKSSLALELLSQGHQLVADDIVDFSFLSTTVIGQSPTILKGLLHQRELGLIDVRQTFGQQAVLSQCPVNAVITLSHQELTTISLENTIQSCIICSAELPKLTLCPSNPASLITRLTIWLNLLEQNNFASHQLLQRQCRYMQQ